MAKERTRKLEVFVSEKSFVVLTCCTCGVAFGIPVAYHRVLCEDGRYFRCPNGHRQCFTVPLEEQVEDLTEELDQTKEDLARVKGEKEKLEARVADQGGES